MDIITLTGETATRLLSTAATLCKTPEEVISSLLDQNVIFDVTEHKIVENRVQAITEQFEGKIQRQREELDALINALPDYIFIIERDGMRIPYCNDIFARIIGYHDRCDVQGKTIYECFPADQAAYFEVQNEQVFITGETLHLQETLTLPTGTIYTDTYKIPLRHADGTIFALLGTSHDITELFETRQALQKRTEELETAYEKLQISEQFLQNALAAEKELGELRTRFLSLVSHEFRTPMAIIQTSIDLLRRYYERMTTEKRDLHLGNIEEQLHTLTEMINEISLVYKGQTAQTLHLSPVRLTSLLQQMVQEIQIAYAKQIRIVLDVPDYETSYPLDKALLQQIFINLISNATKYSKPDDQITISWREQLDYLVVQVRDEGIGIPVEDQRHLFTPFYRGSNVGETGGTGLGLIIAKQAVEAHKGKISFESQENQGTVFSVMLPITLQSDGT